MQPRLIKTQIAEYVEIVWDGINRSGWEPTNDKVLVLPDQVAQSTSGGVMLAEETRDRHELAAQSGVIVALGTAAFAWDAEHHRWEGDKPKPGDRIAMERYAGQLLRGDDGMTYRLMDYKCIGAMRRRSDV